MIYHGREKKSRFEGIISRALERLQHHMRLTQIQHEQHLPLQDHLYIRSVRFLHFITFID